MLRRGSVEAATVGHRGVAAAELARDQAAERMVAAVGHQQGEGGGRAVHLVDLPAAGQQADEGRMQWIIVRAVGAYPVRRQQRRHRRTDDPGLRAGAPRRSSLAGALRVGSAERRVGKEWVY